MTVEVKKHMEQKTTDELLSIWIKNDREEWSNDAFEAVKQILTERGIELPPQDPPPAKPAKDESSEERKTHKRSIGRSIIAIGIILAGVEAALYSSELIFVRKESVLSIFSCSPVVQGVIAALLGCLWYLYMETRQLRRTIPIGGWQHPCVVLLGWTWVCCSTYYVQ